MTDAQERARALWLALQAQSSVDTHQIKILVAFAAQVEAETWEKAAVIAAEFSKPYNMDWWQSVTKKQVSVQICLDVAEKIRQQAQRAKAPVHEVTAEPMDQETARLLLGTKEGM